MCANCSFKTVHNVAWQKLNWFQHKIQRSQLLTRRRLRIKGGDVRNAHWKNRSWWIVSWSFDILLEWHSRHKCRIWTRETSSETIPKSYLSPKVNVWMHQCSSRIYCPFSLSGNITGELYREMLKTSFIPHLTRNVRNETIFQQDGEFYTPPPSESKRIFGWNV